MHSIPCSAENNKPLLREPVVGGIDRWLNCCANAPDTREAHTTRQSGYYCEANITEKELCDYGKRRMVIFSAARKVLCCAMRSVILRLFRSDMIFAPTRAKRISPGEAGYHCEANITEKELCDYGKRRMVIFSAARKVLCCAMRSVILRLFRSDMIFAPTRAKRISPGEAGYHCEAITLAAGEYH